MKDYNYMGFRMTYMGFGQGWYALKGANVAYRASTMNKLRKLIKIERLKAEGMFRGEEHL